LIEETNVYKKKRNINTQRVILVIGQNCRLIYPILKYNWKNVVFSYILSFIYIYYLIRLRTKDLKATKFNTTTTTTTKDLEAIKFNPKRKSGKKRTEGMPMLLHINFL
jgi:hypothetical protein